MSSIPQPGIELIKKYEGCELEAYPDPDTGAEPITNGWGCTRKKDGSPWQLGDRITQEEADDLLLYQAETEFLPALAKIPGWDELSDNQKGALLSFAWNAGADFFGDDNFGTITRVLRDAAASRNYSKLRNALLLYVNPGSSVEEGLRDRRDSEADLFEMPSGTVDAPQFSQASQIIFAEAPGALKITAIRDTFFKRSTDDSSDPNTVKFAVTNGESFNINWLKPDARNHWRFELQEKTASFFNWLSFKDHVRVSKIEGDSEIIIFEGRKSLYREVKNQRQINTEEIFLNVPYQPQTDNFTQAERTCNSSSCAMCVMYLKPGAIAGDDQYIETLLSMGFDSTDHDGQTKVLKTYGINSEFRYDLSFEDIYTQLAAGKPLVLGILHRGSEDSPTGGHMIVCVGRKENGDLIVNDPYGTCNDGYSSDVYNGRGAIYSVEMMSHRWLEAGQPKTGWGRIFQ